MNANLLFVLTLSPHAPSMRSAGQLSAAAFAAQVSRTQRLADGAATPADVSPLPKVGVLFTWRLGALEGYVARLDIFPAFHLRRVCVVCRVGCSSLPLSGDWDV